MVMGNGIAERQIETDNVVSWQHNGDLYSRAKRVMGPPAYIECSYYNININD